VTVGEASGDVLGEDRGVGGVQVGGDGGGSGTIVHVGGDLLVVCSSGAFSALGQVEGLEVAGSATVGTGVGWPIGSQ